MHRGKDCFSGGWSFEEARDGIPEIVAVLPETSLYVQ